MERASGSGTRLAEVLGAFALAGDMGRGQPAGHVHRTCYITMRMASAMGLSPTERANAYYTALLIHAGCTAGMHHFAAFLAADELAAQRDLCLCDTENLREMLGWIRRNVAPAKPLPMRAQRALQLFIGGSQLSAELDGGCSDVGARVAERLGLSEGARLALYHICETWSGRGPHGLKGQAIPLAVRMANAAMVLEVFSSSQGPEAAKAAAGARSGKGFDPDVTRAFLSLAERGEFWDALAADHLWKRVLEMDPEGRTLSEDDLETAALAFADFIDLKSAQGSGHSRAVAELADAIAVRLGMSQAERTLVRRAGLVHDLGQVGVPAGVLTKRDRSSVEAELYRLHPYYTERILSVVPALHEAARIAGLHHEQPDGNGYYRGLSGVDLPMEARVVAAANAYHEAPSAQEGHGHGEQALRTVQAGAGSRYDAECVSALAEVVRTGRRKRATLPGGLTEREAEVLRLLADGRSVKQMAAELVLSEKTVGHHIEHIYNKINVSSRAGATLFAMEHGLLKEQLGGQ